MTRRVLSALLAAAALAAAGCGSTTDDVKSTVNNYLKAFVNGDGKTACSLMTKDTQQRIVALMHTTDCITGVTAFGRRYHATLQGLKRFKITNVKVSGNDAVATLVAKTAAGPTGSETILRKEGGHWRIAAAPGTQ